MYDEDERYIVTVCHKCHKVINSLNLYGDKLFVVCPRCGTIWEFEAKIIKNGALEILGSME